MSRIVQANKRPTNINNGAVQHFAAHNSSILVTDCYCSRRSHRVPLFAAKTKKKQWACDHQHLTVYLRGLHSPPDLSLIVHLWDEMARAVDGINAPPSNLQQLRITVASAWTDIPVERFLWHFVECPEEVRLFWRQKGV